jgi:hypothetical protein
VILQYPLQWLPGIEAAGIDRQQRALLREARDGAVQVQLGADQIVEVLRIALVNNCEAVAQSQSLTVGSQQRVRDRMKRASPDPSRDGLADDLACTSQHLAGCTAGEGQQQNPLRRGTSLDQCRHAGRQCLGLAGAGPGDHQQRPGKMFGRLTLLGSQTGEEAEVCGVLGGWSWICRED